MAIKQNKKNIISIHNDNIDNYYLNITFYIEFLTLHQKKLLTVFKQNNRFNVGEMKKKQNYLHFF